MSIRLIAIDIDGTLMPSSGSRVSDRNRAALQGAAAQGVEIVIATGRRQAFAMSLIAPIGLREDSVMISSNGAVVRSFDGKLMDRRLLPLATARRLCGELRGFGTLVFTFDREGPEALVIEDLKHLHTRIERWVEANRPYFTEIRPIERAFDGAEQPIQGMACGTVDQMRRAEEGLRACGLGCEIAMHRTEYAARDLSILDLLPLGCSKGTALADLAVLRGLKREEVMAIGDNLNDLEMLEYAGRAVVMGNASEEMFATALQRGWESTATNDQDGVAHVVESVLREAAAAREPVRQPSLFRSSAGGAPGPLRGDPEGNSERLDSEDTMAGWTQ